MNITNDIVTEYINNFYKPVDSAFGDLRREAEERRVPIILKETESFLAFLVNMITPKTVLEIGTAVGYSAMLFARLGAEVITIEKDENMATIAKDNIERMGFSSRVTVLTGDGAEVVESTMKGSNQSFDLVFIDAAKSHYKRFLDAALPLCHEGTAIVSDNVLLKAATASDMYDTKGRFKTNIKNMRLYLDYISEHPKLETVILACGDGLALSRYR